ncbi:MAG: hypothetical protein CVV21_04970 [Candidatus Goldiibacteriota bacterium HGW-Goldbacteria-1]|jgi:hypothetical protein|nr:MAG: hypothetical protein CVV21_04970 [Candidatus Goldiibacteriota bacterium HGW-Goldbacteria-1]
MGGNKDGKKVIKAVEKLPKGKAWGKIEQAREFAYSLYEKRGYVLGNELQVWLDADKSSKKKVKNCTKSKKQKRLF